MLSGVGKLSARPRIITSTGGGGGGSLSRSGTADSDHVHTISGLNTLYMIPDIVYIAQTDAFNTDNYSVKDISFTSGSNASHTFYLATKVKGNTLSFHNDVCVGAIQIHTASSVVFAGGAEDTSVFTTSNGYATTSNPTDGSVSFTSIPVATTGGGKWQKASNTSSGNTGAGDSISTDFQNTNNPLNNAGSGIIAQTSATNFIYSESSGGTLNNFIYLKFTVSLATNTAHKFVFAYNFGTQNTDTGDDKDDNVGIFIEN